MCIFAGGSENVNGDFDAGLLPPPPHLMTASDFASRSLNDWIRGYFDGFEDSVADEVTTLAEAESRATLTSRGVRLSGDESLAGLCDLLTVDEQLAIWRRSLGMT